MTTQLKSAELTGIALDWAIARITRSEGEIRIFRPHRWNDKGYIEVHQFGSTWSRYDPSTTIQGNALLDEYKISTHHDPADGMWSAFIDTGEGEKMFVEDHALGETRLIAAMRCLVVHKYGETIDVPDMLVAGPFIEREILNEQSQVAKFSYICRNLKTGEEHARDFTPMQDSAFGDLDAVSPAVLRATAESQIAKWNRQHRDTYHYRLVVGIPTVNVKVS